MKANRHQYLMIGLIVLFIGIQLRVIDSYVLTEQASTFIEKRLRKPGQDTNPMRAFWPGGLPAQRRTLQPPQWVGWALLSVGGVLVLHALSLKPPE